MGKWGNRGEIGVMGMVAVAVVRRRCGGAVVVVGKCLGGGMVIRSGGVRYGERKGERGCMVQWRNKGEKEESHLKRVT